MEGHAGDSMGVGRSLVVKVTSCTQVVQSNFECVLNLKSLFQSVVLV